jgi:hypothetical protein
VVGYASLYASLGGASANDTIAKVSSTANVAGTTDVGGVAGYMNSTKVDNTSGNEIFSTGAVSSSGGNRVGGLYGSSNGSLTRAYATGAVTANGVNEVGGLIGQFNGTMSYAFATGMVSGSANVGGLIGYSDGEQIATVYATGTVTGTGDRTGGLIGRSANPVSSAFATGNITGSNFVGGLIGHSYRNVVQTQSSGDVIGARYVGGLVGYVEDGSVADSSHVTRTVTVGNNTVTTGTVSAMSSNAYYVGGLVGQVVNQKAVTGSYATSSVLGATGFAGVSGNADFVGGLIGWTDGSVGKRTTTFSSSSNPPSSTLLIAASGASFSTATSTDFGATYSYASGAVSGRYDVGGLIGRADFSASISDAAYVGPSVTAQMNYGGLIGYLSPGAKLANSHYRIDGIAAGSNPGAVAITGYAATTATSPMSLPGVITVGGLYSTQFETWVAGGNLNGLASVVSSPAPAPTPAPTPTWSSGTEGTGSSTVYLIKNAQDLRDYLGYADRTDLKFKLAANIDLTGAAGLYIPYLGGDLQNTGGFTVSNLSLNQATSNLGFIGNLRGGSATGDLTSSIAGLQVNGSVAGVSNIGLAAGSTYQRALVGVSTAGTAGGININYNSVPNEHRQTYNYSNVGGIVGYAYQSSASNDLAKNSTSSATVNGGRNVGGLVGYA